MNVKASTYENYHDSAPGQLILILVLFSSLSSEPWYSGDPWCPRHVCLSPQRVLHWAHSHDPDGRGLLDARLCSLAAGGVHRTRVPAGDCLWNVSYSFTLSRILLVLSICYS